MGLMSFNFWTKADIKYLQNDLLPKDIFYTSNAKETSKHVFERCVEKDYVVISIRTQEKSMESLFKLLT